MKYFKFNDKRFNWNTFMKDHLSTMDFLNKDQMKEIIIVLDTIKKDLKDDIKFTEQLESMNPIKVKVRGGKPTRNY
jgi:hypothetical protein|tara:strand:+ start:402 stop:629 length:228 start_codon:yes stop_codon:yes gene_type:complete